MSNRRIKGARSPNICHWLPCSISNDCVAPVHLYFRPESLIDVKERQRNTIIDDNNTKKATELKDENKGKERDKERRIQAAAFRGRELLSHELYDLPNHVAGSVITFNRNSSPKLEETFCSITEWEHKWNEKNLVVDNVHQGCCPKSVELLKVLRSVHDPMT